MVWGTYYIVFNRVVVIHFYHKSCSFTGVFECFVVRNHVNRQISTSREGSIIWILKLMVLGRFLKTGQSEENSFQVLRVSRRKNDWKRKKNAIIRTLEAAFGVTHAWLGVASTRLRADFVCSLFFKLDWCKKPISLFLNHTQSFTMNRDLCFHYFSFRSIWGLEARVKD